MNSPSPETPPAVWAVIECTKGQGARTRLTAGGASVLVRPLPTGVRYPFNYGYVEGTRVADGEEIDVFVLGPALPPASRIGVAIVGALAFADRRGDDPKLIAVPAGGDGPCDLPAVGGAVAAFLRDYKSPSEPRTVGGLLTRQAALALVAAARRGAPEGEA